MMVGSLKNVYVLVVAACLAIQCSKTESHTSSIQYPNPTPDSVAKRFLPGIVSSDSLDFNAAFSPDGKRFYFSRSRKGNWLIYMTEWKAGSWTSPVLTPFTETQYSQADPFITDNGTLYYISNRPKNPHDTIPDYDIWFVSPESDGSWSEPVNLAAVNSDSTEYYVSVALNGNVYFASNREGTIGSHDIYVSRYSDGQYSAPENLGTTVNSKQMEHDPMIAPNEAYLIFTSVDREDSHGSGDLYYSLRSTDGKWTQAVNMSEIVNTSTYEYCSFITKDQQYFFFSSDFDVKWISTKQFPWIQE
jgi:Tol biopolymer transport system component